MRNATSRDYGSVGHLFYVALLTSMSNEHTLYIHLIFAILGLIGCEKLSWCLMAMMRSPSYHESVCVQCRLLSLVNGGIYYGDSYSCRGLQWGICFFWRTPLLLLVHCWNLCYHLVYHLDTSMTLTGIASGPFLHMSYWCYQPCLTCSTRYEIEFSKSVSGFGADTVGRMCGKSCEYLLRLTHVSVMFRE